ncbi:MAG: nucleotidyltransferase family protein [Desulfobacteraceae bacterium]|nr:nucleotidyltransferase family protein [Desulfobacteraceae bacterium]MBC2757480.1 nucleotidyltransferase family protein [Desulfobacteraceae bacterium]
MNKKLEGELLLYCLGIGTDKIKPARLEQLSTSEWEEIIQQSDRNGVAPLLYLRLKALDQCITIPGTTIPNSVLQRLRKKYVCNAWKNKRLYHELSKVLSLFQNDGIPVIVLKGAALAELVFQNIALRPMGDVDLIVKSKDWSKIDTILLQLGFSNVTPPLRSKRHIQWIQHIKHMSKVTLYEIHPEIYELQNHNPWLTASPATIAATDTLILGSEDFLLHLCLHIDRHLREGITKLIWWFDIAMGIKHYRKELNWDYVIQIAKKHKVEGSVHRILYVINEWFDGQVPANVLNRLKDDSIPLSFLDVLQQVPLQNREFDLFLTDISRIPSIHDKIYYGFKTFFPCREFIIQTYSVTRPNLVYFYYFIHISIIAIKAFYQLPRYLFNKYVSLRA